MADVTNVMAGERWSRWRLAMWSAAAMLLALPALAMRFTPEVVWTASDFIIMGIMLGSACLACELAARASGNGAYRVAAIVAVGTAFLTVWVNLAVGMVGSEDNSYNLLFGGVLALALAGGIAARFRAAGLSLAMAGTGIAQAAVGAFGLTADTRGAVFSMLFAAPWLLSALLFRKAARDAAVTG